jgi:hypothetical protein
MPEYKLTREEQETCIIGNAASHEWDVCTADPKMIRKFKRQGYTPEARKNPWGYVSFKVPFRRLTVRKAEPQKARGAAAPRIKSNAKQAP